MSREATLGIDVGTGSTKAGLVDGEGRLLAVGRARHRVDTPAVGRSEIDPERWIAGVRIAVSDVLAQVPDVEVAAVGLSGQMHGVVLCDADGTPTRPAILWSDRRAQPHVEAVAEGLHTYRDRTGNPLVPGMAGPILAAVAAEEPGALAAARWALQPKDWLRLQLTGEAATDPSDASATLLWDVLDDGWSPTLTEVFGIERDLLAPVVPSASVGGRLRTQQASELRLPAGTPVAVGAADTAAALLGAGLELGQTQVATGTGGQIATLLATPHPDPTTRTHLYRAAPPERWYAMAAIQNAGVAIDWARTVLGVSEGEATRAIASTRPGAGGVSFLPYLTGERTPHLDSGLTGRWVGLHPGVSRAEVIRSVYEGVAFALRDGLDALREAGHHVAHASLAGGGSRSGWWQQLLADVLGIPLRPHDAVDASVRGAALLGWEATGRTIDPARHVRHGSAIAPDPAPWAAPLQRFRDAAAQQLGGPGPARGRRS